ncbi:MAG: efflux RND transporter periplasmic adaptor subunit [Polyangiaceae bacterium]
MTRHSRVRSLASRFAPLLLAGAAVACAKANAAEKAPTPSEGLSVTTADVVEKVVPTTVTVTGTLLANRESDVAADASGRVVFTAVERGEFVPAGAVLARLDARGAALSRSAAVAEVAAQHAQSDNAKAECERADKLFAASAITKAELDCAHAGCEALGSSSLAAVARQQMAEKFIGDAVIRAPFAGMIVDRAVDLGEYVSPGRRIATLVEVNPLRLELVLPESSASGVKAGSHVDFRVRSFDKQTFSANVKYVGPVLRRQTHDLVVEALVDNADGKLRPGMFAEAELSVSEQKLPVAPKGALVGQAPSARAFVVKGGVAEERVVLVGAEQGETVTILDGVRPGERVVVNPSEELRDGVRVK